MKKISRILAIIITILSLLAFAGCGLGDIIDFVVEVDDILSETTSPTGDASETAASTDTSTEKPTVTPTEAPTGTPTATQAVTPTEKPTATPTETPTGTPTAKPTATPTEAPTEAPIDENGSYFDKDNVALYIHTYGKLPQNFITKAEAEALGWSGGSVQKYAPGKAIGGDRFGNYEKLLPTGTTYTECDIDTDGASSRGAKRIIFGKDGSIYYTEDHYETFEKLY